MFTPSWKLITVTVFNALTVLRATQSHGLLLTSRAFSDVVAYKAVWMKQIFKISRYQRFSHMCTLFDSKKPSEMQSYIAVKSRHHYLSPSWQL